MKVRALDHLVLTVASIEATVAFYAHLGMEVVTFSGGRTALEFGAQKINLHPAGREYEPKSARPTPGSGDICLVVDGPIDGVVADLGAAGITIEEGPTDRTGATGPIRSVYVRDPDLNLVEIATYDTSV